MHHGCNGDPGASENTFPRLIPDGRNFSLSKIRAINVNPAASFLTKPGNDKNDSTPRCNAENHIHDY